ncbi:hypothetical protein RS130_11755 [Paraglaciecola aquimarina]|uniref:Uncharacterized protein n=1 Tax=Paraglaciecola aquimarina TaxID=1235557 RepID=A0ABU3SWX4_9ALTE|nr:hypothetical protein [Paraglaciecola aquimarina]MDU0354520.1 hypothetical protein [Paraglaciecola aquimarina]
MIGSVFSSNQPWMKVLERGFTLEVMLKDAIYNNNKFDDNHLFITHE